MLTVGEAQPVQMSMEAAPTIPQPTMLGGVNSLAGKSLF